MKSSKSNQFNPYFIQIHFISCPETTVAPKWPTGPSEVNPTEVKLFI